MCSSIGAYIVVKVLKLKPPVSFVFCINIVLVAGDWRKYLDWRIWASLVTDHSMSGSSKKTLPDNISAPNLRLEARLGVEKEVFLVEMIDSISVSKESMSHLKAVYFIRPTSENVQKLRYQLANPRFGEHHLFFSNLLKDTQIHILADSDEHEAVQQVQEFYADFVAGDPYHLTLNMASNHLYMLPAVVDPSGLQRYSDRVVDGIAAVFLALKRRPVIRYQRTSDTAKRIAHETAVQDSYLEQNRRNLPLGYRSENVLALDENVPENVSADPETEETNPYVEEVSMSSGDSLVHALSSPEIMSKKDLFPETGHEEELSEETVLTEEELIFYEDSHGIQLDVGNALVRVSNLRSLYGCSNVSEKSEAHHVFQQMFCRKLFQRRKKWLSAKSWMFKFKEGKHTKALPRFVHKLMEEWFIMPQTKLLRQENLSFAEEGSGVEVKGIFAKFIRFKNDWFRMNVMKVAEHGKKSHGLWQSHRVHQQVTHKWFPGNRRPEHMTFYVIHYQLVYESKQCEHCVFTVRAASERSVLVESMSHLKAVYFIRPTSENIQKLRYQLANPRFGEHHFFLQLKDTQIHILADSDEHEAVQQVQEFYADFVAGDPYHLTLNMPSNHLWFAALLR
ncbi:unnamed protein product [Brassica napus]|uniref:(rape) hypothetical protein n=1 Tax=Brassica napus TaxID=3708 RepID=A0A816QKY5_BRANA|nr:unnamed protein product [Brassica napus]